MSNVLFPDPPTRRPDQQPSQRRPPFDRAPTHRAGPRRAMSWILVAIMASGVLAALAPTTMAGHAGDEPPEIHRLAPALTQLDVHAQLDEHLATTVVTAIIENEHDQAQEAWFRIPLSPHAVLTGIEVETPEGILIGHVEEKQQAAATYRKAASEGKSAVLVESAGRGMLNVRLSVPAETAYTLTVSYAEPFVLDLGTRDYRFPLDAMTKARLAPEVLTFTLDVRQAAGWERLEVSGLSMEAADSAHVPEGYDLRLEHRSEHEAYDRPFIVELDPAADAYASRLVISHTEGEAAAVFSLVAPTVGQEPLPKDIVFVLDVSGSMSGSKLAAAKDALVTILDQLDEDDHFALLVFSDGTTLWKQEFRRASAGNIGAAQEWIRDRHIEGGTNLRDGALDALGFFTEAADGRMPMTVIVTDGRPTVGVTGLGAIIEDVHADNDYDARVHAVGIGFDQDDAFLGELAASTRGVYLGMQDGRDVEAQLDDFFTRINTPLLKDVVLTPLDFDWHDVHPVPTPDVYAGSELIIGGRVDATQMVGDLLFRIDAEGPDGPVSFTISVPAEHVVTNPSAEQLWARQKAASLERRMGVGPYAGSPHGDDDTYGDSPSEHSRYYDDNWEMLVAHGVRYQIATWGTSWIVAPEQEEDTTVSPTDGAEDGSMDDAADSGCSTCSSAPTGSTASEGSLRSSAGSTGGSNGTGSSVAYDSADSDDTASDSTASTAWDYEDSPTDEETAFSPGLPGLVLIGAALVLLGALRRRYA